MRLTLAAALALPAATAAAAPASGPGPVQMLAAAAQPLLPRDGPDAAVFRGRLVFFNYCATCHGPNADGGGRAARLYDPRPANLRTSDKTAPYMKRIVRGGGRSMGRSEFMPPWGEELTEEQMNDVVTYLLSLRQPPVR